MEREGTESDTLYMSTISVTFGCFNELKKTFSIVELFFKLKCYSMNLNNSLSKILTLYFLFQKINNLAYDL